MEPYLNIALIQTDLFWHKPEENRRHFTEIIDGLENEADLIVLPEMFTTGFTMTPSAIDSGEGPLTLDWMRSIASRKNTALVGSIPFFENEN